MEKTELNDEVEIDLSELFKLFKKNIKLIIILALVGIVIAVSLTTFFIDKKYASQGSILLKAEVVDGSIDSSQLSANNMMVNNYIELLQGNAIQNQVASNLNITGDEVNKALTVTNTAETQIIEISATTTEFLYAVEQYNHFNYFLIFLLFKYDFFKIFPNKLLLFFNL